MFYMLWQKNYLLNVDILHRLGIKSLVSNLLTKSKMIVEFDHWKILRS